MGAWLVSTLHHSFRYILVYIYIYLSNIDLIYISVMFIHIRPSSWNEAEGENTKTLYKSSDEQIQMLFRPVMTPGSNWLSPSCFDGGI